MNTTHSPEKPQKEKDPSKKIKTLQLKLKTVEEKYIQQHKEQKKLTSDRSATEKFLHFIFDRENSAFLPGEKGEVEFKWLHQTWQDKVVAEQEERVRRIEHNHHEENGRHIKEMQKI